MCLFQNGLKKFKNVNRIDRIKLVYFSHLYSCHLIKVSSLFLLIFMRPKHIYFIWHNPFSPLQIKHVTRPFHLAQLELFSMPNVGHLISLDEIQSHRRCNLALFIFLHIRELWRTFPITMLTMMEWALSLQQQFWFSDLARTVHFQC